MSKRILRTVPATLLVTTALSWNLPAAAQAVTGSPGATTPGTSQKAPPAAANNRAPAAGAREASSSGGSFGGGSSLPADLTPPASAAVAGQSMGGGMGGSAGGSMGGSMGGGAKSPSTRP